ncbi:monooxygenase [Nocardioides terrae]|uniref:Monooxygenase n=1 Tax=Nocardioides terrae TaxID=574651 RepID=A0A1I1GP65_9ACTN|nr:NAD(P)/FAD-dependent oxidoreductase [Nocardioides terrae]SFC13245.1 monooxygenase [Nocardioides terrae]
MASPFSGTEHVDLVVVGAGLSGIDAAATFRRQHPDKTVVVLEQRDDLGGTWDLFRYPGIRSDSDMFTFAFRWKPWESTKALADGAHIKDYLQQVAVEEGVDKLIRYHHRVASVAWDSGSNTWTIRADSDGEQVTLTSRFLWSCTGYYDYEKGFQPEFPGVDDFEGTFIHPQFWPEDLDHTGKRIVIIGSGATAVTLVPALADSGAGHVTMLQRTPSYILSRPGHDALGSGLKRLRIPESLPLKKIRAASYYEAIRWENIGLSVGIYHVFKRAPGLAKRFIRNHQVTALTARDGGPGFTKAEAEAYVDEHLTPPYNPWDQRLCAVPDGDLWTVLRERRADIVTGRISRITPTGIELESGEHLDADVIVSATGLNIKIFGGIEATVDGRPLEPGNTTAYRGALLAGVPNFAFTIGYINASWTLKADLVSAWVSGLVAEMDKRGAERFVVSEPEVPGSRPLMDMKSGYLLRGAPAMPRQGDGFPFEAKQNYLVDKKVLATDSYDDKHLVLG